MQLLLSISIGFVVYIINFHTTLALPPNYNDVSKDNTHFNEEIPTLENSRPSAKFNPEHIGGHYQGDMIIPEEISRGAAHRPLWQRWPNGIIPYDMTSSISANHSQLIVDAMRRMENLTRIGNVQCIKFRPKTSSDEIFITIRNGTGCSAHVGYLQNYTLNRTVTLMHTPRATCMRTGIIQHELLHVLGFFHEQSRPDRDDYVSIQWNNIINGTEFNFQKYNLTDIDTLNTSYDYGSVMHYEADAFSSNGLPTIRATRNASAVLGQRIGMSPIDILEVQRYYRCDRTSSSIAIRTNTILISSIIIIEITLIFLFNSAILLESII
ncbi:unnamed protein product [Rotaria sordida]|uniref:Metalloendopeptidase n=1 Tax=Rotaria sordida TaxID=392033 RepID=A0A813Z005_9BILA|nr:unnamed protein product [Rotaria sordida]